MIAGGRETGSGPPPSRPWLRGLPRPCSAFVLARAQPTASPLVFPETPNTPDRASVLPGFHQQLLTLGQISSYYS